MNTCHNLEESLMESILEYRDLYRKLDEAGGPGKAGDLFEAVIGMEEEILGLAGLPPAHKYRRLLWNDDPDAAIESLSAAAGEFRERPLKDPNLMLIDAAARGEVPEDALPMAGLPFTDYHEFLYSRKLARCASFEEADAILAEMRAATGLGEDIVFLEYRGIPACRERYKRCRAAGLASLDEYLIAIGKFDLPEEDMDARQFFTRAMERIGENDYAGVIEDMDRVIALEPGVAAAYYNRGVALEALGRTDEAEEDYDRVIMLDPGYAPAYNNRGALLARAGRADAALEDFSRFIEIEPGAPHGFCNRGRVHFDRGDYARALEDFAAAVMRDPGNPDHHCNRGFCFNLLGERDRALEDFLKAARMGSDEARMALWDLFGIAGTAEGCNIS